MLKKAENNFPEIENDEKKNTANNSFQKSRVFYQFSRNHRYLLKKANRRKRRSSKNEGLVTKTSRIAR